MIYPYQVGLFLDAAGKDRYMEKDQGTGNETPSMFRKDGKKILRPESSERESEGCHAGIFYDRPAMTPAHIEWFKNRWSSLPSPSP